MLTLIFRRLQESQALLAIARRVVLPTWPAGAGWWGAPDGRLSKSAVVKLDFGEQGTYPRSSPQISVPLSSGSYPNDNVD